MKGFFNFGPPCNVDIVLNDVDNRRTVEVAQDKGKVEKLFLFLGNEGVSGKVQVTLKDNKKKVEHQGIKVEFIGQIGMHSLCNILFIFFILNQKSNHKNTYIASPQTPHHKDSKQFTPFFYFLMMKWWQKKIWFSNNFIFLVVCMNLFYVPKSITYKIAHVSFFISPNKSIDYCELGEIP